tara:strand:- start:329 stop:508 length:180 start_codon:yes stop_codon:yes gene_type:complete
LGYGACGRWYMENKNRKPKPDENLENSDKQKIEDQKKENSRLAERKGQRAVFPFKRRSL